MKKVLLILTTILFSLIPAGAVKKIEANPINVAYILAQETDSAKIASTLKYYGYELQPIETPPSGGRGAYTNYRHPNGSIIRYTFKDATKAQPYPQVEVKSKKSSKDIDSTLTNLNFKKYGSVYDRKIGQYARTLFQCKHGAAGFLTFHQSRHPRE